VQEQLRKSYAGKTILYRYNRLLCWNCMSSGCRSVQCTYPLRREQWSHRQEWRRSALCCSRSGLQKQTVCHLGPYECVTGLCNRLHRLLTSRHVCHGVMFGNRPNRRTSVSICVSVVKTCDTYLSGLTPCQQDAQLGSGLRIRSSEGAILPTLLDKLRH
jgi:hypothetical protein